MVEKLKEKKEEALARSTLYSLLSAGFAYPRADFITDLEKGHFTAQLRQAASYFEEEKGLFSAVEDLCQAVEKSLTLNLQDLEAEYNRVFSMGLICPHHETNYNTAHVFMKSQEMADINGFYTAFGFRLSDKEKELVDFIGTELEFMHVLTFKEYHAWEKGQEDKANLCREAQAKFLEGHLGTWVNAFYKVLSATTHLDLFSSLGRLLVEFVTFEGRYLGVTPVQVISEPTARAGPETESFTCGGGLEDSKIKGS
ncbi:MAG TPA: TorD/DmsD family molecular chaperone [Candidatus Hypogeohydataceae bacterium YC38]